MPKIPTSRIPARAASPSGFVPQTRANAADFNVASAAVGDALQNLGAGIGQLGAQIDQNKKEQRLRDEEEQLANLKAQADPTPALLAARDASAPDGSDLYEKTRTAYANWISEQGDTIKNPRVRSEFKRYWLNRAPAVMSGAAEQAYTMKQDNSRQQVSLSLQSLENRVRTDPTAYDEALTLGYDALAPHSFLNTPKARNVWQQQLARARFEAKIEQANTVQQLDVVRAELTTPEWQGALSPNEYDNTVDAIDTKRSQMRKATVTVARASLTDMEQRTRDLQPISRDELIQMQQSVATSGDAVLGDRLARIARDQELLKRYRVEGPDQLRARAAAMRAQTDHAGVVNPQVASAVDQGVMYSQGGVSAAYLAATAQVEYGGMLKGDSPDFGVKSSTSSATGLYQFTDDTWLAVVRGEGDNLVNGAADMSDADLLAMRSDPVLSAKAAAALAVRNRAQMEQVLSRPVNDFEMYLAHFMGASKATQFISLYETNENTVAAGLFPKEAEANKNVFYDGGTALTVQQVYDRMASKFSGAPGRVQYEDAAYLEDMATNADKRMQENMMGYARETGVAAVPPLNAKGGTTARANAARIVSSTWHIPLNEVKPLEPSEVSHYKNILSGEDPDAKTEVMALFAQMGPTLAQQAYKQIGTEGNVYAHGGALMSAGGEPSSAYDIVRGRTFIDHNPDFMKAMGLDFSSVTEKYGDRVRHLVGAMGSDTATGGSWQTILEAAYAHYVQTATRRGTKGLDDTAFTASLDAVLGGTPGRSAIGEVNGVETVLPLGVSQDAMDNWIRYAKPEDWRAVSTRGMLPKHLNGTDVTEAELRNSATLLPVGAGKYLVQIDGLNLWTGRYKDAPYNTVPENYVIELNPKRIDAFVATGIQQRNALGLSENANLYLRWRYGEEWTKDSKTGETLSPREIEYRRVEAIRETTKVVGPEAPAWYKDAKAKGLTQ